MGQRNSTPPTHHETGEVDLLRFNTLALLGEDGDMSTADVRDRTTLIPRLPEWALPARAATPREEALLQEAEFEALADEVRRMTTQHSATKARRRPSLVGVTASTSTAPSTTHKAGLLRLVKRQSRRSPRTEVASSTSTSSLSATPEVLAAECLAPPQPSDEAEFLYDMGKRMLLGREGGMELQRNPLRAIHLLRRAAALGHVGAKWDLHCCRGEGDDICLDYARAVVLYMRFAKMGHPVALSNLGVCYHKGRGVRKSLSKAVHFYSQAAKLNYARGSYNLAVCYDLGEGVSKDAAKAVHYYSRSAEQGYAVAQYYMGVCYNHAKGMEQRDFEKAVNMWRKAAKQGHGLAQLVLANYHREGHGVLEKDVLKAALLYKAAIRWGDEKAWDRLKDLLQSSGDFEERIDKDEPAESNQVSRVSNVPSLLDQCSIHFLKRWTRHKKVPETIMEQAQLPSEVVDRIQTDVRKCHNPRCTELFFGSGPVERRWRVRPGRSDESDEEQSSEFDPLSARNEGDTLLEEELEIKGDGAGGDEIALHFCSLSCSQQLDHDH